MKENLVSKFQELKSKHDELVSEKLKCEARKDQLDAEIKSIQEKYTNYDLSSIDSVNNIISTLTEQLSTELNNINEQYTKLKGA